MTVYLPKRETVEPFLQVRDAVVTFCDSQGYTNAGFFPGPSFNLRARPPFEQWKYPFFDEVGKEVVFYAFGNKRLRSHYIGHLQVSLPREKQEIFERDVGSVVRELFPEILHVEEMRIF